MLAGRGHGEGENKEEGVKMEQLALKKGLARMGIC
jgi:hypothetical protein